jgi:arylsulfatase A-like enzyme
MPHIPLFRSDEFTGHSLRGIYGDVVEEIDATVGHVLNAVRALERQTLVVFTSDNGPWLIFDELGGSAGLLRGGKGGTFEGGMREPTIFWGPGIVEPGVVTKIGATMDLLPTACALAGAELPANRVLDGYDLSPTLRGDVADHPRDTIFYYRGTRIFAARHGPYKAHFITRSEYGADKPVEHDPPLLYHLEQDPSEKYNIAADHADVLQQIQQIVGEHAATVEDVPNQLEIPLAQDNR